MALEPKNQPTGIKAPHGARTFEISWADGNVSKIPHDVLRGYCPCAGCQGHTPEIEYRPGGNLELRDISPVGNYALQLSWADGHNTGLYTFRYLRTLSDLVEEHGDQLASSPPTLSKM